MKFLPALLAIFLAAASAASAAEPVKIIFDTDITGDVDDVLALAMCHTLADRGACELLGVTISKDNPLSAGFVDAQNTFYGRPDLPVGVTRDPAAQKRESRFLKLAGSPDYPHDLRHNDEAREAVDLLRELLAKSPDKSISLISVGIASNMANLLKSKGDTHSPLDGPDLIRQKVTLLSIMAGAFAFTNRTNYHLEANVINGIGFMQTVAREWPAEVPVVWSGYEIGEALPFPRRTIAEDLGYRVPHLVREAYLLHSGPEHDRPCWDESSVLYAVFPDRAYFGLSLPGRVSVADDGFTRFTPPGKDGEGGKRDRFLTMTDAEQARALEAIVHLTVQPPRE